MLHRGDYDSVIAGFADLALVRLPALVLAGRHDVIFTEFRVSPAALGTSLFARNEFEGVLKHCPDIREWRAAALNGLGRHREVLSRYPEQRRECARALIAQGAVEDALARYPESRSDCAAELLRQRRWSEVAQRFANMPFEAGQALVELGRYDDIADGRGKVWVRPDQAHDLRARRAMREWFLGNQATADSVLSNPPAAFQHLWQHQRFNRYLLLPVLYGLSGDTARLRQGCQTVMDNPHQVFGRKLWYEAAYLAGAIDDSAFLAQPCRLRLELRLLAMRAIRSDIRGDTTDAVRCYREWLEGAAKIVTIYENSVMPSTVTDLFTDLDQSATVRRLAQLRIEALDRAATAH
jgi:hypothetical protein